MRISWGRPEQKRVVPNLHGKADEGGSGVKCHGPVYHTTDVSGRVRALGVHDPFWCRGVLYLLTQLPEEVLEEVDMLQAGRLELPPQLLQAGHLTSPYLSITLIKTEGTGAGIARSRNNLIRASQM